MALTILILFALVALLGLLLLCSAILFLVSKLFKIENPSFKKSLVIVLISGIASIVFGVLFGIFSLDFLSYIATFFVFYYLLHRYYQTSWLKSLGVYLIFGVIATVVSFALVIPTRLYIYEPFVVSGAAMEPTYNSGDYLFINKLDKNFARGDIVVFRYPGNETQFLIKRIIGLPSENVEIKAGKVFINGQVLDESSYYNGDTQGDTSVILSSSQYFMLGDNRAESADSRMYGTVPKENILGSIFFEVPGLLKNF
ncbi:MAG TPA: signal peptidase I [Candidatus Paceibacterota bacterium]|nr:signal peptidase I [Candidatus Paceibacterota bacterium]